MRRQHNSKSINVIIRELNYTYTLIRSSYFASALPFKARTQIVYLHTDVILNDVISSFWCTSIKLLPVRSFNGYCLLSGVVKWFEPGMVRQMRCRQWERVLRRITFGLQPQLQCRLSSEWKSCFTRSFIYDVAAWVRAWMVQCSN